MDDRHENDDVTSQTVTSEKTEPASTTPEGSKTQTARTTEQDQRVVHAKASRSPGLDAAPQPRSTTDETWRPVVGFEGLYEVSDQGRIRSLARFVLRDGPRYLRPHYTSYPARLMATPRQRLGYVGLVLWKDGKGHNRRVHQLVLEAFVGPCPAGMQTLHGNGVRHDNRLTNLRYGTPKENYVDQVRHGTAAARSAGGKSHCKRRHLLQTPNLRPKLAVRACLACSRALAVWHWMERNKPDHGHDRETWLQTRSDKKYAEIMRDAEPTAPINIPAPRPATDHEETA